MDSKIIGGVVLVCAIVAVAGVLFYNNDFNTPEVNNNDINTENSDNTTPNPIPSTNQLTLTLLPDNQPGFNPRPTPGPNPDPSPSPTPGPTPNPMDHIISLFDAYLKSNYDQSLIPAMAIVIVQNGEIIYMNTLGVKDPATGEPVDENTLFGIGSLTKQFSATNVAQMVSAGNISWDDPISKYYPDTNEFQLYSDYVTNNITIRDALSHRSGLPAYGGDDYYTLFNDTYSTSLYKLRYMENTTPFRSTFQYNNLIYALAGYCAAREANITWNELIKKDLLDPLGMTTAVTSYYDFLNTANHVTPYKILKNGTMMQFDIIPDPIGPAGSIYSSINEMAHWLKFQINDTGYYNGVQIVSKKELDETRTGQIKMGDEAQYGFGWIVTKEDINHAGASDAFRSHITVYPSKGLGIVILSNGGEYAEAFKTSLDYKFRYLLMGNETFDPWHYAKKQTEESLKPVPPTPPIVNQTLPLNGYVGVYSNNLWGNINITSSNDTLICYYGNNSWPFELKHWNNNTFEEQINNNFFNFTDIYNGTAHQVNANLTNAPENVTFNRTNST